VRFAQRLQRELHAVGLVPFRLGEGLWLGHRAGFAWSRRQESNLYLPLRRRPFYPLNYGERRKFSHALF
jgi:hypothetical protein